MILFLGMLRNISYRFKSGSPRRSDLAEFIQMSKIFWKNKSINADIVDEQISDLLGKAWNDWTVDQRSRFVEDKLFLVRGIAVFGESLRVLRSPLVESWLTSHA